MNDFRLYQVEMLHLLWVTPLLALLFWYAHRKRKQALALFAEAKLLEKLNPGHIAGRRWKEVLFVLAVIAIVVSLARPAWNRVPMEVTRRGRDVVFLIDVSRSMLAEDLRPNRLERAKLAVLDGVSKLGGDRVALIAFAGAASVKCPLTLDYGFFRMALEDISPDSVPRGGTLIGDAVRKALAEVFDNKASQYRDLVLITDGEDHESFPVEAAREAGKRGIRLIAIGLGDENVGRRIPITGERGEQTFLKYKGQEVWSHLDATTLRNMAAETPGGRYLNVATGAIDFGDVYQQLIASAQRRDLESETIDRYEEKFQLFLAIGFLLLCGEAMVSERKQ
ncbi:MAG: VWA domain-containing protein [Acidobacteria bacterium]|nr:VWA domain-containing protein [Acidobacteriota bacterium]